MKKAALIIMFFLAALLANGQDNSSKEFDSYVPSQDKKILEAYNSKKFEQAILYSAEWLNTYDKQSAGVQSNYKGNIINVYYNLACFNARLGKSAMAGAWLERSLSAGFNDYNAISTDTDLISLRVAKGFRAIVQRVREKGDYGYILKMSGRYDNQKAADLPQFTYQDSSAAELRSLRAKFNLDSIAGNGDEATRFIKLLYWVHNVVRHDGNSNNPAQKNAIDLIDVCQREKRGVNCRMMATILRDAYQAEGYKARIVTCMPKDTADFDCHVITAVWSGTLNKWVWMDPTFNAYVTGQKGELLGIEEVRKRIIEDRPWELNADANWNNRAKESKADYLRYMSKNLYWLKCSAKSEWDVETYKDHQQPVAYVNLYPGDFSTLKGKPGEAGNGNPTYATSNPDYFWQKPQGESGRK